MKLHEETKELSHPLVFKRQRQNHFPATSADIFCSVHSIVTPPTPGDQTLNITAPC